MRWSWSWSWSVVFLVWIVALSGCDSDPSASPVDAGQAVDVVPGDAPSFPDSARDAAAPVDVLADKVSEDGGAPEDIQAEDAQESDVSEMDARVEDVPGDASSPDCEDDEGCAGLEVGPCEEPVCERGVCVAASVDDGAACDDGDPLTCGDSCSEGVCAGEGCAGQPTTLWGRVWSYGLDGTSLYYDYPWDEVAVAAVGAEGRVAETTSNEEDCTPWSPGEPYMCGTFELTLDVGAEVALRTSDHYGHIDTLTRIFRVEEGMVEPIVSFQDGVISAVSTLLGVTLDPERGHAVAVVARRGAPDLGSAPFEDFIGDAVVTLAPDSALDAETRVVYVDAQNPLSTALTATDPAAGLVVFLNLPPRSVAEPYTLTTEQPSFTFEPLRFPVEAGALSYLIVSP